MVVSQTYKNSNSGVNWTLDHIAAANPSKIIISGNKYTVLENIIIAENDTVTIDADGTIL